MTDDVSSIIERPVFFPGPDGPVFGIITEAPNAADTVVICGGGWEGGNHNANRVIPRLARRLAAEGHNVVRFDWHGAGESTGGLRTWTLTNPGDDVTLAAVDLARQHASLPIILMGVCIGSRSALAAARHVSDLKGLALVSFPVPEARTKAKRAERITVGDALRQSASRSTIQGWFQPATRRVYLKFLRVRWRALKRRLGFKPPAPPERRRSRTQEDNLEDLPAELRGLLARGVNILFLFGEGDGAYQSFVDDDSLTRLRARVGEQIELATAAGDLSGFSSLDSQAALIDTIPGWLKRHES